MTDALIAFKVLTSICCIIVAWRAVVIVSHMDMRRRGARRYLNWLGFGLGYVMLALCAIGTLLQVWEPTFHVGLALFAIASALLIVCDRRKRPKYADHDRAVVQGAAASNDVQQVVTFQSMADICPDAGPAFMGTQLCRHQNRTGPICAEDGCPVINSKAERAA